MKEICRAQRTRTPFGQAHDDNEISFVETEFWFRVCQTMNYGQQSPHGPSIEQRVTGRHNLLVSILPNENNPQGCTHESLYMENRFTDD